MNQPTFNFRERLAYPLFAALAEELDPVCRNTSWNFQRSEGEPKYIETAFGARQIMGNINGIGRVADAFVQGRDQLDVTFSHGKFASLFSYRTVHQQWALLGDEQGATPIVYAPNEAMMHQFLQNSFSVLLLPEIRGGQKVAIPKVRRGLLLRYSIFATDSDGREGVAAVLERV